ncbi:hypothetical protein ABT358_02500 [Streptomyces sp. NPDC000341]|uniref:hypothetical protein n=1 Tax=Streptomyces sp. NPDC000341 TaxID=3156645 RepID=UPI003323A379
MAACCSAARCTCRVTAGPGVTVDGNGSAAAPYVISADAATTALGVTDTTTVDLTLTGDGSADAPYDVTAAVILDPAPPGGGDQLLQSGPDGLFLECEQVRGCISAGDGAGYDETTGVVTARPSTDAGNSVTYGADGGLYAPTGTPAAPTVVEAADSTTVDTEVTGAGTAASPYVVTSSVILDPAPPGGGDQLLQSGPDGLFLECEQVRECFSAGDGAAYDPATGVITARVSADAGNSTVFGSDGGIFTPAGGGGEPTALGVTDSTTLDLSVSGTGTAADPYDITGAVILDPAPPGGGDQLLQSGPDGLFLECEQVRSCITAGDGAAYDPATGVIEARPSTDAGNTLAFGTDGGLLVPPGGGTADPTVVEGSDSMTVDTEVTGAGTAASPYIVTSSVILDPAPPGGGTQLLQAGPDGLFLECEQVRGCLVAGDGAAYDPAAGEVKARLSADVANTVVFGTDGGLFVPAPAAPVVGCGLTGDGSVGAPLTANPIAGQAAWADTWSCADETHSTLKCDPDTGALWTPPEHTSAALTLQQNHPMGTPSFTATGGYAIVSTDVWSEGTVTADTVSVCRGLAFSATFTGHLEASWTAGSVFSIGYAVQINGGALGVRVMHSRLQAGGVAGRERFTFSTAQAAMLAAHTGYAVRVYPAIQVTAGTVTLQQWITDTHMIVTTR